MLKTILFAAFLIFPGATCNPASGQNETEAFSVPQGYIENLYRDYIYAHVSWAKEDVIISGICVREKVVLPTKVFTCDILPLSSGPYLGNTVLKLVFRANGQELRKIQVSGNVSVETEVACAARSLKRHEIIQEKDLVMVRRNIGNMDSPAMDSIGDLAGCRVVSSIRAGEVLKKGLVEPAPVLKKGDPVTIIAETDNLIIRAAGEAQEEGPKGGVIYVRYMGSKKPIRARILDGSTVKIEI